MATGTYCGTADLKLVYSDYGNLMGTAGTDYGSFINAASDWLEASFYAHDMTPPPVSPMDGSYDYWLRRACACMAVYMAADSILSERTDSADGAWWARYNDEAETILSDIHSGSKRLSYQTSTWQDSISPAVPWVNGTTPAPPANMLHTSGRIGARYEDNVPRIFEVELDGSTGTEMSQFTYKYRVVGTSAYMGEGQPCDCDSWVTLGWKVAVLFTPPSRGSAVVGQRWRIYCTPRGENVVKAGCKFGVRNWA